MTLGEPGPDPAVGTSLTGTLRVSRSPTGLAHLLSVLVAPAAASGPVSVLLHGQVLGSGDVVDGVATVRWTAPAREPAGLLTVVYAGDARHEPAATTV